MSETTYRRRVALQGPVGVTPMPSGVGNTAALTAGMDRLAAAFSGISADMQRKGEEREVYQADEEARTAPILDAEGNISTEQRDPLTRAGRVFNAGMLKRTLDHTITQAETNAVSLRAEAAGDPVKFRELWDGYSQGILQRVPEWMRPEATASLARQGAGHLQGLQREAISTERGLQAATFSEREKALEREGMGLAAAGETSGPAYESWRRRYDAHMNDGVTTRQLTPELADIRRNAMAESTLGAVTVRQVQERVRAGGTREEVLRDFDAQMDRQRLPPGQRDRLRNMVEGQLAEADAIRREARSEATNQAEDWQARITGGVPVAPEEGAKIAADLETNGAPRLAQRVRDINAIQQDARVYGTLPTAELARKAQENAGRVLRPDATARDVQLSELTSRMLQRRQEAMRDDPLAAGSTIYRNSIGALSPLDMTSPETIAAGLQGREAQARAIAAREGRPIPALTRPEAEGLRTLLENGTVDQQQAVLTGLRGLSPSTMASTLDALVKGENTAPRVQGFVVAAARPAMAQEILRGMDAMRQFRPQAVEGNAAEDRVREKLQAVIGNRPEVMAQIGQAARAIYTQRHAGIDGTAELAKKLDASKFDAIIDELLPTVTMGGGVFGGATRIPVPPIITGSNDRERQSRFDEHMARMPASALEGARAADGRPFTHDMLRRGGRLVPVDEGVFHIRYNGFNVLREDGRAFRLDMTRPWPAETPGPQSSSEPRGIRNNNPLNLSFAGQEGATMEQHSTPRFARFASMEEGVAASVRQLARYQERGVSTLSAMISRWAPPSENDTPAYVQRVSRETGIAPDAVVNMRDPETVAALVQAMAKVETGRTVDAEVIRRGVARGIG